MSADLPAASPSTGSWTRPLPIGLAAWLLHVLIMIQGYNENESGDGFDTVPFLIMAALSLVITLLLFRFVVPGGGAKTALVLAIVAAVAAVVAFWAMFSLPIAAAAAVVALRERERPEDRTLATVALVIAVLAAVATIAITIGDYVANN